MINLLHYLSHSLTCLHQILLILFLFLYRTNKSLNKQVPQKTQLYDNIFVKKPKLGSFQAILVTIITDHSPIIHVDTEGPRVKNNDSFISK